ncbi:phosphopantetheine-binding protein [Streptomyces sp. RerS4]|uniref:phosphopantetheine-binding protein n=1 Tax=Streptomyces sp. RerS4 TaxID=2942449 RepID=UPI00201CA0BD|nr:phosphopantetheine-binding protein [Streptomyces sp. RerS4]UQX03440.1 phosphopantetheine-binding protein [Streptomyces sp. RerS4]
MLDDSAKGKIKTIVCDTLEIEEEELTEDSDFMSEHDADSMRLIEIVSALELTFGVNIKESDTARLVDLNGVYAVLAEAQSAAAA